MPKNVSNVKQVGCNIHLFHYMINYVQCFICDYICLYGLVDQCAKLAVFGFGLNRVALIAVYVLAYQ